MHQPQSDVDHPSLQPMSRTGECLLISQLTQCRYSVAIEELRRHSRYSILESARRSEFSQGSAAQFHPIFDAEILEILIETASKPALANLAFLGAAAL
jgi:hypothetical protein